MQAVSPLWGRTGTSLQGKGGVVVSCWGWFVSSLQEVPAHSAGLLLAELLLVSEGIWLTGWEKVLRISPGYHWYSKDPQLSNSCLVCFLLWFTDDQSSLHWLPGHAFLLPDVSLCMFSLQGSEWNASNLEDLQNRGWVASGHQLKNKSLALTLFYATNLLCNLSLIYGFADPNKLLLPPNSLSHKQAPQSRRVLLLTLTNVLEENKGRQQAHSYQ